MARFRAVIFDLDGTLLDTLEDIAACVNAVRARRGLAVLPAADYRPWIGEGMAHLVARAFAGDADLPSLTADLRAEYERSQDSRARPYEGVPELLDRLCELGLPMAILSNKPEPFVRRGVAARLGRWSFVEVRGARPGAPLKPDPAPALEIAAALGAEPAAVAFVGDTAVDVRTARLAGMFAAGALWGFRGRGELEAAGARELLARPQDLLALVGTA